MFRLLGIACNSGIRRGRSGCGSRAGLRVLAGSLCSRLLGHIESNAPCAQAITQQGQHSQSPNTHAGIVSLARRHGPLGVHTSDPTCYQGPSPLAALAYASCGTCLRLLRYLRFFCLLGEEGLLGKRAPRGNTWAEVNTRAMAATHAQTIASHFCKALVSLRRICKARVL